jgi:hypothetical protein
MAERLGAVRNVLRRGTVCKSRQKFSRELKASARFLARSPSARGENELG